MVKKLIEKLKKVKDERKKRGQRHELWVILVVILLGIMHGNQGYRAIGDFDRCNQAKLTKLLKIENKQLPSYSTIRRIMMTLEWTGLLKIFNEWGEDLKEYNDLKEEWLAIDRKGLRNTVVDYITTIGLNLFRLFDFQSITKGQRWLQGGLERLFAW